MLDGSSRTRDGRRYGRATIANYEGTLRRLVVPKIGPVPVATLTRGDVQRLVNETAAQRSVEHARQVRAALASVLRLCDDYGELDSTPCLGIRVERAHDEHEESQPVYALSPAESAALLAAADADDESRGRSLMGPFVRLALATGLRRGELLALRGGRTDLTSKPAASTCGAHSPPRATGRRVAIHSCRRNPASLAVMYRFQ